jgi:hypothetical protein
MEDCTVTKKAKLEQYDALSAERDLLSLYFYDIETGRKPDATVRSGKVTMRLFRATGAQGGYVVLKENDGATSPRLVLFEELQRQYAAYYDNETLPLRICIERMNVERHKLFNSPCLNSLCSA